MVCQCQDKVTRIVLCEDDQDTVVIEVCVIMWVALKLNANNIGTCGQLFSHAASLLHTLSHTSYTYDTFSLNFTCTQNGYWAVFTPSISGSNLEFYPCPPGYCACTQYSDVGNTTCVYTYTNSTPDRQCACDREGMTIVMLEYQMKNKRIEAKLEKMPGIKPKAPDLCRQCSATQLQ